MRLFVSLLAALVPAAFAESPFRFEATPGKLPKEIIPRHYTVRLEPDLEKATFRGRVAVEVEVRKATRRLVLNSAELEVTNATVSGQAVTPQFDAVQQTITLATDHELPPGSHRLEMDFAGKMSERPAGLFLARYRDGARDKRALATQMEPTDARRVFPCWDEPAFRAVFELTAVLPKALTVASNMPAAAEQLLPDGRRETRFAPTPSMPTYLVALFAGEFDTIEDEVEGVKLRALTTPGRAEHARYALEATKKVLPYYHEYFGTRYPLPKLDQISLPSTGAGGMENWGAILYSDAAFLYDPATSSQATRESVFSVVAHELAHQWFGNLVTMAWWDNLWLNEGFASWMGTKATDRFNPEWQTWLRAAGSKEWAMSLDARATTHPIQQPVATEDQALDAFDAITYQKGQAFIRMLENFVGETSFQGGIQTYLKRHAYSNTTTADLWIALEESSGKAIRAFAAGWTEQPGFPVVTMKESGGPTLEIAQERFTLNDDGATALYWAVPITLGPAAAPLSARTILLKEKALPGMPIESGATLKANVGDVGYYRVSYDDPLFQRLQKAVPLMAAADRLNLFNDTWAMALAGRGSLDRVFDLAETLAGDEAYVIVDRLLGAFAELDRFVRDEPAEAAFHAYARRLLTPHLTRLGWEPRPGERALDAALRSDLIQRLGAFGDSEVKAEAVRRVAAFLDQKRPLPGDLRLSLLTLAGREASPQRWKQLSQLALNASSTEVRQDYLAALAANRDPALAAKTLALSTSGQLAPEVALDLIHEVATRGRQPALAVAFARDNLSKLLADAAPFDGNAFLPRLYRQFTEEARAAELEALAQSALPPGASHQVAKALNEIRLNAALKKRLLPAIDARCRAQPGK